ncbi:MAG: hypothetical protein WCS21_07855 [Lachnospiraceae bacterium]
MERNVSQMSDECLIDMIRSKSREIDELTNERTKALDMLRSRHPEGGRICSARIVTRERCVCQSVAEACADSTGRALMNAKRKKASENVKWSEHELSNEMKKCEGIFVYNELKNVKYKI